VDQNEERLLRFGRHVRRLRRDRDLSQEALADAAHIHRTHLSAIERGGRAPGLLLILDLAIALGISPKGMMEPFDPSGEPTPKPSGSTEPDR
jgi:transcriptional regulator with XRE-family HTH domain